MSYGVTIELDEYNDLHFDPVSNRLVLIKGVDNCLQAIRILLKTLKGELRIYPEFGVDIPQLLDKNISDDNIKHAVMSALIRDPRVKTVDKVTVERDRRILNVYVQLTTYEGAILEFKEDVVW